MKSSKNIVAILLIAALIFVVAGCSKTGIGGKSGDAEDIADSSKLMQQLPKKLQNPDVTLVLGQEPETNMQENIRAFEQKYGGKMNVIIAPWNQLQTKLITSINAGDSPDVTYWNQSHMPVFAIKGLLQPIDEYIDINSTLWNKKTMEFYKYGGKNYGVNQAEENVYVMYFNKSIFENNGLKTPLEYEKEGKWNWESFRELGMALTQDLNNDGVIDQWGYAGRAPQLFIAANGADIVGYEDSGNVKLTMNDPKLLEALQFIQDGFYKDKYFNPQGKTWREDFIAGKTAMLAERQGVFRNDIGSMKYEWDIAKFPDGPSGAKGSSPSGGGGCWGIPAGAKNIEGAVAWMQFNAIMRLQNEEPSELYTEEQLERIGEYRKSAVILRYPGIGNMNNLVGKLWTDLKNGLPVTTAIDKAIPGFQAEIDMLFKE